MPMYTSVSFSLGQTCGTVLLNDCKSRRKVKKGESGANHLDINIFMAPLPLSLYPSFSLSHTHIQVSITLSLSMSYILFLSLSSLSNSLYLSYSFISPRNYLYLSFSIYLTHAVFLHLLLFLTLYHPLHASHSLTPSLIFQADSLNAKPTLQPVQNFAKINLFIKKLKLFYFFDRTKIKSCSVLWNNLTSRLHRP